MEKEDYTIPLMDAIERIENKQFEEANSILKSIIKEQEESDREIWSDSSAQIVNIRHTCLIHACHLNNDVKSTLEHSDKLFKWVIERSAETRPLYTFHAV